jgi:hypothetical protein
MLEKFYFYICSVLSKGLKLSLDPSGCIYAILRAIVLIIEELENEGKRDPLEFL